MKRTLFANEIYDTDQNRTVITVEDGPDGCVDILASPETGYAEPLFRITNDNKLHRLNVMQQALKDKFGPKIQLAPLG